MNTTEIISRARRGIPLLVFSCLLIALASPISFAQAVGPQRDKLLNGLKVLFWPRPGDQTVLLKLRIHSGAAFDPADKAGTMALLGDILFPDAITHDFFTQDMGGKLEVETSHDAIDITLQGRASDYDRIVDILRGALLTTQLSPETVAVVKAARLKAVSATKLSPAEVADQLARERVLGSFPYARTAGGTVESLTRTERADLMLAREKFLSPNNATLVIIGGVDRVSAMRALRQLLGGWRRSDQVVPSTFRQPDPIDQRILIADSPSAEKTEVRLATRGLARSDPDYFAATLLTVIARDHWRAMAVDPKGSFAVSHDLHVLPGVFLMGASVDAAAVTKTLADARVVLKSLVDSPVAPSEFESAKSEALAQVTRSLAPSEGFANAWMDIDTYSTSTRTLAPVSEQLAAWNAVTAADLQRVAARLFRDASLASVVVGNAAELKAQLSATSKIEILGEAKPKLVPPPAKTTTPPAKQPVNVMPKNPNPFLKDPKPQPKPE